MTSFDFIPVPPDLGAVLASPVAYQEWALSLPVPATGPRVRRPGRIRRSALALAGLVVGAAAVLTGCGVAHHAPAAPGTPWLPTQAAQLAHAAERVMCRTPSAPAGTRIQVDAHGNAWTMGTHVSGPVVIMACAGGTWHAAAAGR